MTRYFGSISNDNTGLHNIRAAEFFLVLSILESCYLHNLTAEIISSRCVNVTRGYIERRSIDFARWGLIGRTPIASVRGVLCYSYRLLQPGRKFIDSIPDNVKSRLINKLESKNGDLMSLRDSKLSNVCQLESSVITKHNRLTVKSMLKDVQSVQSEPTPQPQPEPKQVQPAEPPQPVKHPVEFIHYQDINNNHFICSLSDSKCILKQVDFVPRFTIEGNSAEGCRYYFKLIKSGELKLVFIDGVITRD